MIHKLDEIENYKLKKYLNRYTHLLKEVNKYKSLNQAQRVAGVGSWEMDFITKKSFWSDEAYRIYGIAKEQYDNTYEGFKKFVHPDDVEKIDVILNKPSRNPINLEFRIIRHDSSVRNINEIMEFVFDEKGNPTYVFGTIKDVTEEKELQRELDLKQEKINKIQKRYSTLIKESIDVFEILDADGTLLYISEASEHVIGYKPEERIGKKIYEYYNYTEEKKLKEMMEFVLKEPGQRILKDIIFKTKTGESLYLEVLMQNLLHEPAIEGIVVNFRDITKRVEMEKRITHISTHDQLTELPNKIYFKKKLRLLFQNAKRTNSSFDIYMLDIDSYKYIKDTLGYQIGEEFIIKIATKLKCWCGTRFICRYSEDRFAIIIEGIDSIDEKEKIANEIIRLFSQTIKVGKYEFDVNVSMGISSFHEDGQDIEQIIRHAETALFMAKSDEKNEYKFYYSDINIQSYKQLELRNNLKNAIVNNQFRVYYQPIVNLHTNEIISAEALIRWEHPDWGMISPIEFISLAEKTDFIINIGDWVLREVCRNYRQWIDMGLPKIKISVNFSGIQFFQKNFVESLMKTINEFRLNPNFLIMEVTESILMVNTSKVVNDINSLQSYGIQIALDDFGTGYSSLSYLNSFKIDILKIDRSFVRSAINDETSSIITKLIIQMAEKLKIKLVAEGIENREHLTYLQELNCYAGQGYLFSRPVPVNEFLHILSNKLCEPILNESNAIITNERRNTFRIKFPEMVEAELVIKELRGRIVDVGNTKVVVKDMGPGGLCFISNIKIPTEKDVTLQFITQLTGRQVNLLGYPKWLNEIDNEMYEYGIEFNICEEEKINLIEVLSQFHQSF